MITIHTLDVQLDVAAQDGEEETFKRLFQKHIKAWSSKVTEEQARARWLEKERALGDRPESETH